jgi:hypothetical protein
MSQRKEAETEIQERYRLIKDSLSERSRRLFAGSEATEELQQSRVPQEYLKSLRG